MCASTKTSRRHWQQLFIALQTFVIVGLFYELTLITLWHYDDPWHPGCAAIYNALIHLLRPMLFLFLAASLFLVLASPFLIRSLGRTALVAYFIGFAMLLSAALILLCC